MVPRKAVSEEAVQGEGRAGGQVSAAHLGRDGGRAWGAEPPLDGEPCAGPES